MNLFEKMYRSARSAPRPRLVWTVAACLLILSTNPQQRAQSNSRATLSISVPAVGAPGGNQPDHYWVYANGHLLGTMARPDGALRSATLIPRCPGFEVWDSEGMTFKVLDGRFQTTEDALSTASVKQPDLFVTQDFDLPPGHYIVQVAFVNHGASCDHNRNVTNIFPHDLSAIFPLAFSLDFPITVAGGHRYKLFIPPPTDYQFGGPDELAAAALPACSLVQGDQPSDSALNGTERDLQTFKDSPVVVALLHAAATYRTLPNGLVRLEFPPQYGGTREYDAEQIQLLTAFAPSLLRSRAEGGMPTHEEVAACRQQYPQFSKIFDTYDKIIDFAQSRVDAIDKLKNAVSANQ